MAGVRHRPRRVRGEAVTAGIAVLVALVVIWWRTASLAPAVCAPGFGYLWICEPGHRLQVAAAGTAVVLLVTAGYGVAWWHLRGDRAQQAMIAVLVAMLFVIAAVLVVFGV